MADGSGARRLTVRPLATGAGAGGAGGNPAGGGGGGKVTTGGREMAGGAGGHGSETAGGGGGELGTMLAGNGMPAGAATVVITAVALGAARAISESALAVPSKPHLGQLTPTGMIPFTGSTSKP